MQRARRRANRLYYPAVDAASLKPANPWDTARVHESHNPAVAAAGHRWSLAGSLGSVSIAWTRESRKFVMPDQLICTFNSDRGGWLKQPDVSDSRLKWDEDGGDPGGFLRYNDPGFDSVNCFIVSSAALKGDRGGFEYGTFSFDLYSADVPSQPVFSSAGIFRAIGDRCHFAFLTCEPNVVIAPIHPKAMPVILHPQDEERWLAGEPADLVAPFQSQLLLAECAQVSDGREQADEAERA